MPDLSQVQGRQTTQNRLTNNRDAVLPNRRDLDTPNAVVRADMRNAFRGDDADEVRRALGLVNQAVDGVMDIRKAAMARQSKTDAATGGLDAAAGKAYDQSMAKSKAYQDAYYKVSSEQKQTTRETGIESQVTAMVNQGAHIEDIHKFVMDSVSAHATEAKDIYPSDEAKPTSPRARCSSAPSWKPSSRPPSRRGRTRPWSMAVPATVIAALNDGRALDFEASVKPLLDAGIAPDVAKESIRHAVTAVALDPNHPRPELLMELMSSTQADGKTSSHSAEEQLQLEQSYLQAENLQKKKEKDDKEDRQSALTLKWYDAAVKGQVVDDEIDAVVREKTLTPQEGVALRHTFGGLRDDEREGEANERERPEPTPDARQAAPELRQHPRPGDPVLQRWKAGRGSSGQEGLRRPDDRHGPRQHDSV